MSEELQKIKEGPKDYRLKNFIRYLEKRGKTTKFVESGNRHKLEELDLDQLLFDEELETRQRDESSDDEIKKSMAHEETEFVKELGIEKSLLSTFYSWTKDQLLDPELNPIIRHPIIKRTIAKTGFIPVPGIHYGTKRFPLQTALYRGFRGKHLDPYWTGLGGGRSKSFKSYYRALPSIYGRKPWARIFGGQGHPLNLKNRCLGRNKYNEPCRRHALNGDRFCYVHQGQKARSIQTPLAVEKRNFPLPSYYKKYLGPTLRERLENLSKENGGTVDLTEELIVARNNLGEELALLERLENSDQKNKMKARRIIINAIKEQSEQIRKITLSQQRLLQRGNPGVIGIRQMNWLIAEFMNILHQAVDLSEDEILKISDKLHSMSLPANPNTDMGDPEHLEVVIGTNASASRFLESSSTDDDEDITEADGEGNSQDPSLVD